MSDAIILKKTETEKGIRWFTFKTIGFETNKPLGVDITIAGVNFRIVHGIRPNHRIYLSSNQQGYDRLFGSADPLKPDGGQNTFFDFVANNETYRIYHASK